MLTNPFAISYPGCDYRGPFSRLLQAKMSIQYSLASVLVHRRIDEGNFRDFRDPQIARLAGLIDLEADPEFTAAFPDRQGCELIVTMKDGRVLRDRVDDLRRPTAEEVRTRYRVSASHAVGEERAIAFEQAVERLESLPDAADLAAMLAVPGGDATDAAARPA